MTAAGIQNGQLIEWAVAARPLAGQAVSGDLHLIQPFNQSVLLAVVDGVGHGAEATAAAHAAVTVLERHPHEHVISLIRRCHEALIRTRGVVLTAATLNARENTVTWLGIGNVEGRLLRADAQASHPCESVLLRGGLVGYQLPAMHASVLPVAPGDLLIFATDGVHPRFDSTVDRSGSPEQIAGRILSQNFKGNDDALVLVARYLGLRHE